ncbi:MAG: acyltransferase [Vampirovibrionales bacterium]|nr:acyltransferase [Vampirovibrionales bacterium]
MDDELKRLHQQLVALHHQLRQDTFTQYHRINPFYEDLFDWKERGEFLFGPGKNITVYNTCSVVGDVQVGANTWIGPYTALDGTGGIKIGSFCSVSSGVNILTHDTVKWALTGGKAAYDFAPVEIGDCCFIGTGAVIMKGVTVGHHCVIGAGAIVTKDIPDFSIVFGVPAKITGQVVVDNDTVAYQYF